MKTTVIIPTYNERENIKSLITNIIKLNIHNIHVLVVDDNSPDQTWKIVQDMSKKNKHIHLLRRMHERGRGSAGIAGFKAALKKGADLIIEMDADYSHNPKYIPSLIEASKHCDLVLGSRLVKGGKDVGRPYWRQLLTIAANWYIKIMLGLKVYDCNSGFRCFRKEIFVKVALNKMVSTGPSIVQELLYKTHLNGFEICEIPIHFVEREKGTSKLGFKHLYKGYIMVLHLKWWHITGRI